MAPDDFGRLPFSEDPAFIARHRLPASGPVRQLVRSEDLRPTTWRFRDCNSALPFQTFRMQRVKRHFPSACSGHW